MAATFGALLLLPATRSHAATGDILVADSAAFGGTGGVIRVNPTTGVRTAVSQNSSPLGGPSFSDPVGSTFEGGGDILVADETAFPGFTGGVIRIDPASGARTTVSQNLAPTGGPSFGGPSRLVLQADGRLLVADEDGFGGTGGGVIAVNPTTGARTTVSQNADPPGAPVFVAPYDLALEADGRILVVDQSAFGDMGGGVIRVNPAAACARPCRRTPTPPEDQTSCNRSASRLMPTATSSWPTATPSGVAAA